MCSDPWFLRKPFSECPPVEGGIADFVGYRSITAQYAAFKNAGEVLERARALQYDGTEKELDGVDMPDRMRGYTFDDAYRDNQRVWDLMREMRAKSQRESASANMSTPNMSTPNMSTPISNSAAADKAAVATPPPQTAAQLSPPNV